MTLSAQRRGQKGGKKRGEKLQKYLWGEEDGEERTKILRSQLPQEKKSGKRHAETERKGGLSCRTNRKREKKSWKRRGGGGGPSGIRKRGGAQSPPGSTTDGMRQQKKGRGGEMGVESMGREKSKLPKKEGAVKKRRGGLKSAKGKIGDHRGI